MSILSHILAMVERGFSVIPLAENTKDAPVASYKLTGENKWPSNNRVQIKNFWHDRPSCNYAISTNELAVFDLDEKKGKHGVEEAEKLFIPEDTFTVETLTGGQHRYFKYDAVIKTTTNDPAPGIDLRGLNGYVVGPGSIVDDKEYRIIADLPVKYLPTHLHKFMKAPGVRRKDLADYIPDDEWAVAKAKEILVQHPGAVEGEGGNDATYKLACELRDTGISTDTAAELMEGDWNDRCSPPWPIDQLEVLVENAFEYAQNSAGSKHISNTEKLFETVELPDDRPHLKREWYRHEDPLGTKNEWLFLDTLPTTGVAFTSGASGIGKTFYALHLAEALARNTEFAGHLPDNIGGSLFLLGEGEDSFKKRLAGLDKPYLPIWGTPLDNLGDNDNRKRIVNEINEASNAMFASYGVPTRLVVIDTLSASGLVDNENDNSQCAAAMRWLNDLSRTLNMLVLVTHHPSKSGEDLRGGSALLASADYHINIASRSGSSRRTVMLRKARGAPERSLGSYILERIVIGRDDRGRDITSQKLTWAENAVDYGRRPTHFEDIERALDSLGQITAQDLVNFDPDISIEQAQKCLDYGVKYSLLTLIPGDPNRYAAGSTGIDKRVESVSLPARDDT